MRIAFDAQPLIDSQKTGVGYCEAEIATALMKTYPDSEYYFEYFGFHHAVAKRSRLKEYAELAGTLRGCNWFPGTLYRALWNFIPVPYQLFFKPKADVTHFFNYHVPPGVGGKKIATIHDMAYKVFPETVRLKTKVMLHLSLSRSIKRADKIMAVSEFTKSEIIKYFNIPAEKIFVAYNGVDTNQYQPASAKSIDAVREKYSVRGEYFLYLGTLEPRKNIERLIEAYASLKRDNPSTPILVIAGRKGWLYDSIFEKVTALAMNKYIVFTDYVDDADKPALLSGAKAFLFPSLYEGFGIPPLEAMACGTPTLTSNASSLPEVVGDAAILVDPYSVPEIKNGMKQLMDDESLRQTLSEKGFQRAALFTWERSAETVMNEYRKLMGN